MPQWPYTSISMVACRPRGGTSPLPPRHRSDRVAVAGALNEPASEDDLEGINAAGGTRCRRHPHRRTPSLLAAGARRRCPPRRANPVRVGAACGAAARSREPVDRLRWNGLSPSTSRGDRLSLSISRDGGFACRPPAVEHGEPFGRGEQAQLFSWPRRSRPPWRSAAAEQTRLGDQPASGFLIDQWPHGSDPLCSSFEVSRSPSR